MYQAYRPFGVEFISEQADTLAIYFGVIFSEARMDDLFGLEVSGIDEIEDAAVTRIPAKTDPDEFFANSAFRVIYQTNNFLLPQIRDLIERGDILNIRPEYQRRLRWGGPQKSRLIESLLLNIPIPPIFLYETDEARYEVMDGQQRLNAVKEYFDGDFALSGLQVLTPLNGLRYGKAPPRIKRALDRASLSAIVLLLESETERNPANIYSISDIRRFIFDRLNTGGTKLNAQEIRNSLYPGLFNKAVVEMTRYRSFTERFGIPPYTEADPTDYYENPTRQKNNLYSSMGDCQLVLRYFALRDNKNIRGSMKAMLDRAMQERMPMTAEQANAAKAEFESRFSKSIEIFGEKAFVLPPDEKGRERISAALYDASLVAVNRQWKHVAQLVEKKAAVRERLKLEFANDQSGPILTGQGNTAQAVKDRISLIETVLVEGAGIA